MAANVNGIDLQEIAGAVASSVQQALQAQVQVTPGSEASTTSKARFVCFVQLRSMHLLPLGTHAQRGLQYLVCVGVSFCVSVCLIIALQALNRLMSDTNGSSATSARTLMWGLC